MPECEKCGATFETDNQLRGHMMSHARSENRKKTVDRKKRVGLGAPHKRLSLPEIPGKHTHWINDKWGRDPTRIQRALAAGYEFIDSEGMVVGEGAVDGNQDPGNRMSRTVGTNKDGSQIVAYAMAIDQELYDEYQAEKQVPVDRVEASIKRGQFENKIGETGFVPEDGISMTVER
uniref:C2H2-type domain-containing protein n=1 Tax=viral metagenome TaxID=1070528 RepID=A0A6M3JIT5_9ZZZZ